MRATACGRDLETSFRVFRNCKLLFITLDNRLSNISREIRMLRIRPYAMLRGFDCAYAPLKMTRGGVRFAMANVRAASPRGHVTSFVAFDEVKY